MSRSLLLAWSQLRRDYRRLLAALIGVAFAVVLMLVQLGFRDALFESATLLHSRLLADIVLVSSQYEHLLSTQSFTRRRLYQALAFDGVESVAPLYIGLAPWTNPETRRERPILMIGFEPHSQVLDLEGAGEHLEQLLLPDRILFDAASRTEFGPVADRLRRGEVVFTEVAGRRVRVAGLFEMGTSFAADGNLVTSDLTFLRLARTRRHGLIDVGLVRLRAGADPEKVRAVLEAGLPRDVRVLRRGQFVDVEKDHWSRATPIGFIFGFSMLMAMIVGAVIVYQILFTDVSDHLPEYATLRAMGWPDRSLFAVVLHQSWILSILGFLPGFAVSGVLYAVARHGTLLPIGMTIGRAIWVLVLTLAMCGAAGALAMRRLRAADPAEIF